MPVKKSARTGGSAKNKILCGAASIALSLTLLPTAAWAQSEQVVSEEYAGADRYETAALISQDVAAATPESTSTVILVRGDNYADALAASGLAGLMGCQVLITPTDELGEKAQQLMTSWNVSDVIIMGGQSAIAQNVADEVSALPSHPQVERVEGADRFETASEAYQYGISAKRYCGPYAKTGDSENLGWAKDGAIVASGNDFADALSASPVAACFGMPVFLADGGTLSESNLELLSEFESVYLIGGEKAISRETEEYLRQQAQVAGFEVVRLGGADRYQTCTEVVNRPSPLFRDDFCAEGDTALPDGGGIHKVIATTGANYPDALVAGTNTSIRRAVPSTLYLVDDTEEGRFAIDAIAHESNGPTANLTITFAGGNNALPDNLRQDILAAAEGSGQA